MAAIGGEKFDGTITIGGNAYVYAQGGNAEMHSFPGLTYPADYLGTDAFMAGAGIGTGGWLPDLTGSVVIKDKAVVITQGGNGNAHVGSTAMQIMRIGHGGPGIGPAGMNLAFRRVQDVPIQSFIAFLKKQGLSDEEIAEKYPVINQSYFSPLTIHSLGVWANGGDSDYVESMGLYAGAGSKIGTGGTPYRETSRWSISYKAIRDGFPREGVYEIRYHSGGGEDTEVPLQYYDNGTTLPSADWLRNFSAAFPAQRYSEWTETFGEAYGQAEGVTYSGNSRDLYLVQNPILMEVEPSSKSEKQPLDGQVVLRFNEAMDTSNSGATVTLKNVANGKTINLSLAQAVWSENNMTCTVPYGKLRSNTKYLVSVAGFKDIGGTAMRKWEPSQFITTGVPNTSADNDLGILVILLCSSLAMLAAGFNLTLKLSKETN